MEMIRISNHSLSPEIADDLRGIGKSTAIYGFVQYQKVGTLDWVGRIVEPRKYRIENALTCA